MIYIASVIHPSKNKNISISYAVCLLGCFTPELTAYNAEKRVLKCHEILGLQYSRELY